MKTKQKIRVHDNLCYNCGKFKESKDREMCFSCFLKGYALKEEDAYSGSKWKGK